MSRSKHLALTAVVLLLCSCSRPSARGDAPPAADPPPTATDPAAATPPVAATAPSPGTAATDTAPGTGATGVTGAASAATPPPTPAVAMARVKETIPRWLKMLQHGDDAAFIEDAVVPEELDKVLGGRPKSELVADFKKDKHDAVVKVLGEAQAAQPAKTHVEGARLLLLYEIPGEKKLTFVVDASHVYIRN